MCNVMFGIDKFKVVASKQSGFTFLKLILPLPSLYSRYDAAAGLIISLLLQSCTSQIAMKGAWQTTSDGSFRDNCIFHSWKKNPSRSPSFYLLLFTISLPVSFPISDLWQRQSQWSKHLCCSSLRVTQKINTQHLRSTIWPKSPQLNTKANARIKIHTTPDTA